MDKEQRAFFISFRIGVMMPLSISLVTAALLGVAAYAFTNDGQKALRVFAVTWLAVWLVLVMIWTAFVAHLEGISINLPAPVSTAPAIKVYVTDTDGEILAGEFIDKPAMLESMKIIARGVVYERRGLSEKEWTGKGKPFSKRRYNQVIEAMIERGLIAWANDDYHSQGRQLTRVGRAVLLRLAEEGPAPTPLLDGFTPISKV